MAGLLDKQITCPVLIGRAGQVESLGRALEQARAGTGRTVLVAGEAGIGKSRLVAEAKARAADAGFQLVEGNCFEPDRAVPYAPLLDLLRAPLAAGSPEELARELGPGAPDLVGLLPELGAVLPGLSPAVALEPEQARHRLFHALARLLAGLAGGRPLLVIVEDLHWGDEASLDFLLHLARRIADQPILLLLTYRTDEPHPGLRHLLAELDRGRLATELPLAPLSRADVGAMLRAIFAVAAPGRPVRAELPDALYALTEGNPFFIEEVLTSLAGDGELRDGAGTGERQPLDAPRIPRSVQDTVWRRLVRVSPPAQRLLTLAAVAGRRFDFALLQELAGQEEGEVLRHLKELVAVQLVVEESAERFAFRHALTRQAVYAQLLARERRALHRAIAETVERLHAASPEAHLPDLAYHSYEAGLWERALRYARRMGERAQAMDAPRAAAEHFTHALEAAQQLAQPPSPALLRARGQAYEVLGDFERARDDYERALDGARAAGEDGAAWQGLLDLGFLWQGRDYGRAGDFFRQALALAERTDDPQRLARSLTRLGNWHVNVERPRHGQELHRRALAIFEQLGDRHGVAETLDLLALAIYFRGDRRGAIGCYEEAAALFRALDERRGLASALATLAHLRSSSRVYGTLPGATPITGQALREGEEALALAREIGWRSGEAYALGELAACLAAAGEYGGALAAAQESLAIAGEIEHRQWQAIAQSTLGIIHLDLLAPPAARRHAERGYELARASGSPFSTRVSGAILAAAHLLAQEPACAEAVLRELAEPTGAEAPVETLTQAVLLAAHGELGLARGEPGLALRVADRLIAWAETAGGAGVVPRLWQLRGEALAALGRAAEAEAALRAALQAAREQGARPLLWRLHLTLGELLRAQARREEAEREEVAARAIVEGLAATVPAEAVREGFRGAALARLPAPRPPSPRRAAKAAYGGLTAREREVAALIGRGWSNREIAAALFVSERTVEAHTGHIRDKLGLTSRAQVAAWAIEKGLVQAAG